MSTLQIRKLQSGAFKHVDSIDGDFFLGRFNFKQEFNKAFLVEAYGAKRREYVIANISVYNYLGSAETFTNWTDLLNRLTDLGYTGIETNGIIPTGNYLSDDPTDYSSATLPLAGTEQVLVEQGGTFKKVYISDFLFTWEYLVANWSVEPSLNTAIAGGDVYDYTLNGTTRYRFVPTTYDPTQDAFYESFDGTILTTLITKRG